MSALHYCRADTVHGPWWYAWSESGVVSCAHGALAEKDFLERVGAHGGQAPAPARVKDIPGLGELGARAR